MCLVERDALKDDFKQKLSEFVDNLTSQHENFCSSYQMSRHQNQAC